MKTKNVKPQSRTSSVLLILIVIYTIFSGINEVTVGITGNWLGILSKPLQPSISTAVVGSFYGWGGLALLAALLTRKRWVLWLSVGLISVEFFGRFYLMIIGEAPSHGADFFKILVGAAIAAVIIIYLITQRKYFKK